VHRGLIIHNEAAHGKKSPGKNPGDTLYSLLLLKLLNRCEKQKDIFYRFKFIMTPKLKTNF
jgi:hypothetical protein